MQPPETIYGTSRFDRSRSVEYVESIHRRFSAYYTSLGYAEYTPVPITSKIDPTVRFVGSHVSVLKPHLLQGTVPTPGYFIVQNCLRTQNLRHLWHDAFLLRWC